jgi:hypothetical protein
LTVTNDSGKSDSTTQAVSVAPAPPLYDPGSGPKSASGGGPVSVSPLAPQSLVTSSRAAGGLSVGFSVGFALPSGSDAGNACSGSADVAVSAPGLRKVHGTASVVSAGNGCGLAFKLKLPKGYAGKKAKFVFSFAGNDSVAPWSLTRKLAVK